MATGPVFSKDDFGNIVIILYHLFKLHQAAFFSSHLLFLTHAFMNTHTATVANIDDTLPT